MTAYRSVLAILVLSMAAAVSSAVSGSHPSGAVVRAVARPAAAGRASTARGAPVLHVFGSRGAAQSPIPGADKIDGALADLVRHAALPAANPALLHALNPAAKFKWSAAGNTALVAVDAVTRGDPGRLRAALESLGLEHSAVYANDVGGWLPMAEVGAAAARTEVHSLRAALSRPRTGAVTSQGDYAQHSAALRAALPLTGAGITVGVLSDSYDCYSVYAANGVPASGYAGYASNGFLATAATDMSTGDLASAVDVIEEADCLDYGAPTQLPFSDEGRAMLQVVHDVAPGAALQFYTAENSEADFANGIAALAKAGAKVIADDVGYFDEPFYQDGLLAQAVDTVAAGGVAYFSAAGNDGTLAYENIAPVFGTLSKSAPNAGEYLLNFDASAATTVTTLPVTVAALEPGEYAAVVVEWDQPYVTGSPSSPGASSRIDLCITGAMGSDTITNDEGTAETCSGANAVGSDPVQILIVGNPADAAGPTAKETLDVSIGLAGGTAAPGRVKVAVEDDGAGSEIDAFAAASTGATLQGHPGAAGAAAVGAAFYYETPACGTSPAVLESFSSEGGAPILFDTSGNRLATPIVREKPDFVGPDGGNDTFLGGTLATDGITGSSGTLPTSLAQCQNAPSFPNFFGTSAATPHAAGIAALILQANAAVTPDALIAALQTSALPMSAQGTNFSSGHGFIQADAAIALIPPGAPALTTAAQALMLGASTTITWRSVNAGGCSASGAWSGALSSSGSQTITPATVGTAAYFLTCSNTAGRSATATANIAVAAATGHSGGGALDALTLSAMGLLTLLARSRACRNY